MYDTMTSSSF